MLKHHLLVAVRSLQRQPGYVALNVLGLALGMACCLLLRYVRHETSYDRFHARADRIHRVLLDGQLGSRAVLRSTYPDVEAVVRLNDPDDVAVRVGEQAVNEAGVLFADPSLFRVSSFGLLEGDPARSLRTE